MVGSSPKISVIMTVRNGERFIERSLSSVLSQSYSPDEIVIVNDGSRDRTAMIVESFFGRAIPVNLINAGEVGRAKALNMAWRNSRGDWIANLDVDDDWHPDKLKKQVESILLNPGCKLISTDSIFVYEGEEAYWNMQLATVEANVVWLGRRFFYSRNPINHSSVLMDKLTLEEVGGYNESLNKQIDYDLWIRIVSQGYLVGKYPMRLTAKRIHINQSFEARSRLRYLAHALKMNYRGLCLLRAPFPYYLKPLILFLIGIFSRKIRRILKQVRAGLLRYPWGASD